MIYNLSTILNEIMKQTKEKSNSIPNSLNKLTLNKPILNKIALNRKIFDIDMANKNSFIKYNAILNQKPKFSALETCTSIDIKNQNQNQIQEFYKKIIKKKLFVIGVFCTFLASFTYLNLNYNCNCNYNFKLN
jgi:hypothetical protein